MSSVHRQMLMAWSTSGFGHAPRAIPDEYLLRKQESRQSSECTRRMSCSPRIYERTLPLSRRARKEVAQGEVGAGETCRCESTGSDDAGHNPTASSSLRSPLPITTAQSHACLEKCGRCLYLLPCFNRLTFSSFIHQLEPGLTQIAILHPDQSLYKHHSLSPPTR